MATDTRLEEHRYHFRSRRSHRPGAVWWRGAIAGCATIVMTEGKVLCSAVAAPWNFKPYRSRWSVTRDLNGSNDSYMVQAMARSTMIRK